jgi:NAD/NADP transhydrogenase beta subunit
MEHTTHEHTTHTKQIKNIGMFMSIIIGSIIIAGAILYSGKMNTGNNSEFIDPDTIFSGRE